MAKDNTIKIYDASPEKNLKQRLEQIAANQGLIGNHGASVSAAVLWLVEQEEKRKEKK